MCTVPVETAIAGETPRRDVASAASDAALLASCGILAAFAATLASAAAGLALGRPVTSAALLAGAGTGIAVPLASALARDRSRRAWLVGVAGAGLFCAIVAVALRVAPWRYDTSFDGVGYHEAAVLELARGWNPWRAPRFPREHYSPDMLVYFPKGAWIVQAAIFQLTGRLEAAKATHVALLAAAGLAAFSALRALRFRPATSALLAALAALNPVAICQSFTFYVDGLVASTFTALAALGVVALVTGRRVALLGAASATVALVDVKLTGVPYALAAWTALLAAAWARGGSRAAARCAAVGGAASALALGFTGYNPYVTNTIAAGHPLHPAAGPHATNFVRASRPPTFNDMTRVERVFRSVFSPSSTDAPDQVPRLKLPFTVVGDEVTKFHAPDVRVAGLGPFFGGALLAAALALLLAVGTAGVRLALFAAFAIAGTVLLTGEGWWARLAPQLWLVPLVLVLPAMAARARLARAAAALAVAALVVDVAIVAVNHLNRNRSVQASVRAQLAELRAEGPVEVDLGPHPALGERLTEAGVRWSEPRALHCEDPVRLAGAFFARACRAPVAGAAAK
jgi:hypothetical protein